MLKVKHEWRNNFRHRHRLVDENRRIFVVIFRPVNNFIIVDENFSRRRRKKHIDAQIFLQDLLATSNNVFII